MAAAVSQGLSHQSKIFDDGAVQHTKSQGRHFQAVEYQDIFLSSREKARTSKIEDFGGTVTTRARNRLIPPCVLSDCERFLSF